MPMLTKVSFNHSLVYTKRIFIFNYELYYHWQTTSTNRHSGRIYEKWNRDIELTLGFMDLDLALLELETDASGCASLHYFNEI